MQDNNKIGDLDCRVTLLLLCIVRQPGEEGEQQQQQQKKTEKINYAVSGVFRHQPMISSLSLPHTTTTTTT